MTDTDRRIIALEATFERVRTLLEGKPIYDLTKNNVVGYSGGMVKSGERSAEQLILIEHRLKRIETRITTAEPPTTTRPPWTRTQRITLFSIGAPVTIGLFSSFWTTVQAVATWIVQL